MLINVLSSIAFVVTTISLGVAIYLTLLNVKKLRQHKSVYGDLSAIQIHTLQQIRRLRELKELEYKCYILVAVVLVLFIAVAVQF